MKTQIFIRQNSINLLALILFLGGFNFSSFAQKKKKKKQDKQEVTAPKPKPKPKTNSKIKPYSEIITKSAKSNSGLFKTHQVENIYYFEIPDSLLQKDMLIVSRRAAMSGSEVDKTAVGERVKSALMVRWEKAPDNEHILLKKVTSRNLLRYKGNDKAFEKAVALQTLDPILLSIPVKAIGPDSASSVIEISDLFLTDIKELTPFGVGGLAELLGFVKPKKYVFKKERSFIEGVKSYERNIETRSLFTYTQTSGSNTNTITVLMHRSMILLPDNPMQPRLADKRIGHFTQAFSEYNENEPVSTSYYVKRWRLEVKEEDIEKAKRGELVEPKNKIVFYLDHTTPKKWRTYIRQGIEDWKGAFEEAGFKNAIEARDIPADSEDFEAEDIRYSVVRYVASDVSNARGPSVVDPRSGEIIESDIIVYHNIIKTLRDWRFSQTAANDKKVRTTEISDEIIGEGLRYVIAHEVGHSLGLRHNMGASAAFPVDSLRSVSFTQKFGTTPSIMDYARFNYIAQPEDVGVKLSPPQMGVYDKYAIKWAYKPIMEASNEYQETEQLNKWILEKHGDARYYFGEGDFNGRDPGSQRESLGDDVLKASEYGMKNTQYILDHFNEWLGEEGEDYEQMEDMYLAVLKQNDRYMSHVGKLIGGAYLRRPLQGQSELMYKYVSKDKQKQATRFLINQMKAFPDLLEVDGLQSKLVIKQKRNGINMIIAPSTYVESWYKRSMRSHLINDGKLMSLIDQEITDKAGAYSASDLLSDIRNGFFTAYTRKRKLTYYQQLLQNVYVDWLLAGNHMKSIVDFKPQAATPEDLESFFEQEVLCSHFNSQELLIESQSSDASTDLHLQVLRIVGGDKKNKISGLLLEEVTKIRAQIIQHRKNLTDSDTKTHYNFLLKKIDLYLKN